MAPTWSVTQLDDDAGGRFAIDAITGVVTVAGAIDRETAASYNITVRATSTDSSTITSTLTIRLATSMNSIRRAVTDTNAAANVVAENAANGTVVNITAFASDADATTNAITYSLQDNDGGRFAIDANTGVVTVAGAIDREADGASRWNITVRATSADGSFTDQVFTIAIDRRRRIRRRRRHRYQRHGQYGCTKMLPMEQPSESPAWQPMRTRRPIRLPTAWTITPVADSPSMPTLASSPSPTELARTTKRLTSHNITVRATSADASFSTQAFTINIERRRRSSMSAAMTDTNAAANAVDENAANGTVVGITALASDAGCDDQCGHLLA